MEPVLFYGVPSGCSFGSIVALEWLGKPYRLSRVEMVKEDFMSGDYRFINPVGGTPALITGSGAVLTESIAILNHLGAESTDTGLAFAQATEEFDRLNRMLAFLNTSFFNSFAPLWYVYEHGGDEAAKAALRDYGGFKVRKAHADLDRMLGDKQWLLGDRKTLADAYFFGIARWTDYHDVVKRADYPNIERLYRQLEEDPAVKFAHAIEDEKPAQSAGGYLGNISVDDALKRVRPNG
ncbi:glutathione S-transferase family protein [Rhizobium lusitanum]|uniref:Glutathione S-transferase n=1 Tax=Rhizobium lusitanum TaxID=293958 RepID=A0A7X0MDV2_9HYPH|nr:glutathione S-transferase family protein [Rhizobium lusitanum]MBB6485363.1 glutathione S-transferase [Rhizobium lusitanum]